MFEIDKQTGKLSLLQKFVADFTEENPSLNNVVLSFDNSLLATGGDDTVVRIYAMSKDFKNHEKKLEIKVAEGAIQSIDISRDNRLLVAGSKDGTAYVTDLTKKGAIVQKLNFKPAPNQKNMNMRSMIFARDNSLYTLTTMAQMPTYLIRWQCT